MKKYSWNHANDQDHHKKNKFEEKKVINHALVQEKKQVWRQKVGNYAIEPEKVSFKILPFFFPFFIHNPHLSLMMQISWNSKQKYRIFLKCLT